MKNRTLVILGMLCLSLFTGFSQVSGDANPPVVYDVWFSMTQAQPGDTVNIYVDAYDPDGIMSLNVDVFVQDDMGGTRNFEYISLVQNGTYYQGSMYIESYDLNGTYFIEWLYIDDNAGYYHSLNNGLEFNSPYLNVLNPNQDNVAPVLNNIVVAQSNVTAFDYVDITASVTETQSGISYINVDIYRVPVGYANFWEGNLSATVNLYIDSYGNYSGSWYIGQYQASGNYVIGAVQLADNANNYAWYENSTYVNSFNAPMFTVYNPNGDSMPPVVSDFYFEYSNVPDGANQRLFASIYDDLSGINYIDFEIYFVDEFGSYQSVGYAFIDMYSEMTADGYYVSTVYYYYGVPAGADLFVDYIYGYDNAGNYLYMYNGEDFFSPSYSHGSSTTPPNQEPNIEVTLNPTDGYNDVGQPVLFDFGVYNRNATTGGTLRLQAFGPDGAAIEFFSQYMTLYEGDARTYSVEVRFNSTGYYEIKASFETDFGEYYYATGSWEVGENGQPPHGEEQIKVDVSPNFGESRVNETVFYETWVQSSFGHDMPNVTLVVEVDGPNGFTYDQSYQFYLPSNSSVTNTFEILYPFEGTYFVRAVLFDDVGSEWIFEFNWKVLGPNQTTDDSSSTSDNTSSVTETVTDTNSTDTNSTEPTIALPLPGFELPMVFLGFISIFVTTYVRRRS